MLSGEIPAELGELGGHSLVQWRLAGNEALQIRSSEHHEPRASSPQLMSTFPQPMVFIAIFIHIWVCQPYEVRGSLSDGSAVLHGSQHLVPCVANGTEIHGFTHLAPLWSGVV